MIRYLDETLPGQSLTPKEPQARALMEQWISVETSNFTPHAMTYIGQYMFAPMHGKQPDLAKIEEAKPKLESLFFRSSISSFAKASCTSWATRFTLADVCFMPYVGYEMGNAGEGRHAPPARTSRPWWNRVSERALLERGLSEPRKC